MGKKNGANLNHFGAGEHWRWNEMSAEVQTPYSVAEVAALTGLSAATITKLFQDEPGVIAYQAPNLPRKRRYRTLRIPRHVYQRVLRRLVVR